MNDVKVCPLRMMALESELHAVRNTGNAAPIVESIKNTTFDPDNPDPLRETIGCLGEDCAWWCKDKCAMRGISYILDSR